MRRRARLPDCPTSPPAGEMPQAEGEGRPLCGCQILGARRPPPQSLRDSSPAGDLRVISISPLPPLRGGRCRRQRGLRARAHQIPEAPHRHFVTPPPAGKVGAVGLTRRSPQGEQGIPLHCADSATLPVRGKDGGGAGRPEGAGRVGEEGDRRGCGWGLAGRVDSCLRRKDGGRRGERRSDSCGGCLVVARGDGAGLHDVADDELGPSGFGVEPGQHRTHWLRRAAEGMQHQAEDFQRDRAE